ncbi:MAG: thioredoxin family protein [Gammaproteobacteria bacterium]|nr:thioredoxin family protein [Gammaproteobacteria bacterium]
MKITIIKLPHQKNKSRLSLVYVFLLPIVLLSSIFISSCSDNQNQSNFIPLDGMTRLTDDTITETIENSTGSLLVHFTSYDPNCGYCANSNPYIEEVMQTYKNKLRVARISWEPWRSYAHESKDIKKEYWIRGLPMVVLYKDGEELWRGTGNTPENKVKITDLLNQCCS